MLNGMMEAGIPEMEVTSFSHPKLLPQFADCVEVLQGIRRDTDARFRVLMPNRKGWDRFEACLDAGYGAHKIILMISASEEHNLRNFRATHEGAMAEHAKIMERAHAVGVEIIGCVGTVYGCAIEGDVSMESIEKLTRFYHDHGAQLLMLGDTTGQANPSQVERVLAHLLETFPNTEFLGHFHDTRGTGIANAVTALNMGIRWLDGSLGAIGGHPAAGASLHHLGFTGNICSEDFLAMMDESKIKTGVDIDKLITLGKRAEEVVGFQMRSNVIYAGRVDHQPSSPEKGGGAGKGASAETT